VYVRELVLRLSARAIAPQWSFVARAIFICACAASRQR